MKIKLKNGDEIANVVQLLPNGTIDELDWLDESGDAGTVNLEQVEVIL